MKESTVKRPSSKNATGKDANRYWALLSKIFAKSKKVLGLGGEYGHGRYRDGNKQQRSDNHVRKIKAKKDRLRKISKQSRKLNRNPMLGRRPRYV